MVVQVDLPGVAVGRVPVQVVAVLTAVQVAAVTIVM